MKKYIFASLVWVSLSISVAADIIQDTGAAINIAGKQRMLTQRIMADYALIGMHSDFQNPDLDLQRSIEAFESGIKAIKAYSNDSKVLTLLEKEQKIWESAKEILENKPNKEEAKALSAKLDKLLHYSNDIVVAIKTQSNTDASKIIDMSGRQRMLSQRIASLYILNLWVTGNRDFKKDLDAAMQLFKKSMEQLKVYEKNTKSINMLIGKVEKTYRYFEMMNSMPSSMHTMPSLAYKKLNEMLVNMDKVTQLYAAQK